MKKTALNLALVVVLQGCSGEGLLPTRTSQDNSPPVQMVTLPQPQPDEIVGKRLALIIGNGEYSEIGRLKTIKILKICVESQIYKIICKLINYWIPK